MMKTITKLFSKNIRSDSIKNYSMILEMLWILGIICSLILFLYLSFFQTSAYSFDPSTKGFSVFLKIYEFPIKLATASVVLFGLWLTIERMKQTDKQIESIVSNNRFNNFYKHREEFIKFMSDRKPFSDLIIKYPSETKNYLIGIYGFAFSRKAQAFNGILDDNFKKNCIAFTSSIGKYFSIHQDIKEIEPHKIKNLLTTIPFEIFFKYETDLIRITNNYRSKLENNSVNEESRQDVCTKYLNLSYVIFFVEFINSIFAFAGEKVYTWTNLNLAFGIVDAFIEDPAAYEFTWKGE